MEKVNKMKDFKLKECPCCGGEARFVYTLETDTGRVRVVCNKCDLSTGWVDENLDYGAKEEAAKVWNRRESKQPRCPICGEEGFHILTLSYLPNKARAQIHCDMCGTYINIPDTSKCVGEMSELVHNEK